MSDEFEFLKSAQRYRWKDSKKFVSQKVVDRLRSQSIARAKTDILEQTELMLNKDITVDEWERSLMGKIKEITIQNWQLGKPGEITLSDRGTLGSQLRFQYNKLWGFRQAILDGKLSGAQIRYRTGLYLNKTRWAYEAGRTRSHINGSYLWERRIKPASESCQSCISYNNLGWQPIGFLPEPTEQCECMANCKCFKEYSDSPTIPQFKIQDPFNNLEWELFSERNSTLMKVSFELPDIYNASQSQVNAALLNAEKAYLGSFRDDHVCSETQAKQLRAEKREERENLPLSREEISAIAQEIMRTQSVSFVANASKTVKQSEYAFGAPTEEQFEKLMKYLPKNTAKKLTRQDFVTVPFVASNNFVWWSLGAWTPNALADMAVQYPAKPFILDHNTWTVKNTQGMVYDAHLVFNEEVDEDILHAVNSDCNHDIFQRDGYVELITLVAFQASHVHLDHLKFGRARKVSTGSYVNPDSYICPLDGTRFGEGDRWYQCAEGHNVPYWYMIAYYYSEEQMENLAPYFMIDEVTDTEELSQVIDGNLPAATLIIDR